MRIRKGTLVKTTMGKIGEVVESESWVIKDENGIIVSDAYPNKNVCDIYRMEINSKYTTSKLPCLVKLGKNVFPIFSNNLEYLKVIFFKFKDYYGNEVVLRQNQSSGLILKKFLEKANIKFFMYSDESEINSVEGNNVDDKIND